MSRISNNDVGGLQNKAIKALSCHCDVLFPFLKTSRKLSSSSHIMFPVLSLGLGAAGCMFLSSSDFSLAPHNHRSRTSQYNFK